MKTVGVDIGSYSIKVAELESTSKGPILRDFFEVELNHEPGQDTRLEKLEALKKISIQYGGGSHKIVVGLGSEFSATRVLNFPFTERAKIAQSLPFELEDVIPFSQEGAIFDFRLVETHEKTSKVFAVAVPKKYIQESLHLCEDGSLDPDILGLEGVALANLLSIHQGESFAPTPPGVEDTAELIIHIGFSKTLLVVVSRGRVLATRALFYGGKDLTYAVMKAYQYPFLEALKGVAEKSFVLTSPDGASEEQVHFSQVMSDSLNQLATELKRTIVDLKSEHHLNFTAGHLMGGMGRMINLGPYLTALLEMPVAVFEHLGHLTRVDTPTSPSLDKASSVAIGLALEGLRKSKTPAINLRKQEFAKQSQVLKVFLERYATVAKMAAAIFVLFIVYTVVRSNMSESLSTMADDALKEQGKNPTLGLASSQLKPENIKKIIKAKRDEIESKKEVIRLNTMTSALDVMKQLSQALPSKNQIGLDMSHINIDGEKLIIEGVVRSKPELDLLQTALGQVAGVSQVKTLTAPQATAGRTPFAFTMLVARLKPVQKK